MENNYKNQRGCYKEVKNHLHNTLEVSKEYIDEIIKESVQFEISRLIKDGFFQRSIDQSVQNEIRKAYTNGFDNTFYNNVRGIIGKEVGKLVAGRLNIDVTITDEPQGVNVITFSQNPSYRGSTAYHYDGIDK